MLPLPSCPGIIFGLRQSSFALSTSCASCPCVVTQSLTHKTVNFFSLQRKQTFAIPGSLILNITSGRLFGEYYGFAFTTLVRVGSLIVCDVIGDRFDQIYFQCTTLGACCCYVLSYTFLQGFVRKCFPQRLAKLQITAARYRSDLLYYLVIMRAVSFIPNWFINLASPVLRIPLFTHTIAVGLGMAPYHWICSSAGSFLAEIDSPYDIFDRSAMIKILLVVVAAVAYLVFRRRYSEQAAPAEAST